MRITGGTVRGLKLISPRISGVRPMTERARKALFDILGPRVCGAKVLDLFSGTGALGLEALSRGAEEVVFAEASPRMVKVILENLERAGFQKKARVLKAQLPRDLKRLPEGPYDLIFITPPYGTGLGQETLVQIKAPFLAEGGLIVVEERKQESFSAENTPWELVETRKYGETVLYFLRRKDGARD